MACVLSTQHNSQILGFYIDLPIGGFVLLLLLFTRIPDQKPKGNALEVPRALSPLRDLDLIGFVLFAFGSVQLLLELEYGGIQYVWNNSVILGLFCGAGATVVALVLWERHMRLGPDAIVPANLLTWRYLGQLPHEFHGLRYDHDSFILPPHVLSSRQGRVCRYQRCGFTTE
jgi:hypothetical protein